MNIMFHATNIHCKVKYVEIIAFLKRKKKSKFT